VAMDRTAKSYLDPSVLAAIGSLELRARMIVEGVTTGMHRSPFHGVSVEFAHHRPYSAGDDIRHLDWKVYGRTDRLYVRQYEEETNLDLVILVDASGSMGYASQGGWRKYDHAASVAAAVAYLALRQQDRVGLVLFSDHIDTTTRTTSSRGHWRSIVETLTGALSAESERDEKTDMERVFEQVVARLTQRSLVVLIGDLFDDPDGLSRGLARLRYGGHDLIAVQTLDPAELGFPFRSPTEFVGLEGEGRLGLDPASLKRAYLGALEEHLERVEKTVMRFRYDYLMADTSRAIGAPLSRFLARRAAALSRGK